MADDDLDCELANHLELVAQEHRDRGATEETARRAARSTLGPTTIIREDVRALSPLAAWSDAT